MYGNLLCEGGKVGGKGYIQRTSTVGSYGVTIGGMESVSVLEGH